MKHIMWSNRMRVVFNSTAPINLRWMELNIYIYIYNFTRVCCYIYTLN
jgi:hypothetical protein